MMFWWIVALLLLLFGHWGIAAVLVILLALAEFDG